jgi:hypothetical protein
MEGSTCPNCGTKWDASKLVSSGLE